LLSPAFGSLQVEPDLCIRAGHRPDSECAHGPNDETGG
jgi:hypothetical protein